MKRLALLIAAPVFAAQIPAGTELSVRLTDKIATETAKPKTVIHAVLIAPVIADGKILIPMGAQFTGEIKLAKPAADKDNARLQIVFAPINAIVSSLENARESVDDKGTILGITGAETYGGRLNEGIAKLSNSARFGGLGGLIEGAKQALKIQDVNANIDYDSGTELTLKVTAPFDWKGTTQGPEAKLQPFPGEAALSDLVNRQPFRTIAEKPPRPSDMTNLMFIAAEDELKAAFEKAGWASAARLSADSALETARAMIENRGYKEGPMSILLLEGEPPAFAYQKGTNTFAQRHHLRIFRRPDTFAGKPVWVCSSTHDTGIDFSDRDRTFIHKVDPEIDRERAKVVNDLLFTGAVRSLALVDRPNVPVTSSNATGDVLHTDGHMAVLLLQ